MSDLVPAATLERKLQEVVGGQWRTTEGLEVISEQCASWKSTYPEQFAKPVDRFDTAREGVRAGGNLDDWQELEAAASALAEAFSEATGC